MKIAKFVLPAIAAGFMASSASANSLEWTNTPLGAVPINNPNSVPGTGTLEGWVVNDLVLTTTADWTAAAMLIELDTGSIFQEGEGFGANGITLGEPNPAGLLDLPSSEFATYIFDPHGGAAIAGAAGDVGGDAQQFDTAELDISWNSAGADTADIGTFSIARVTLSPDAFGTARVAFTVAGVEGVIRADIPIIPEPASGALLGLAGLAVLRRR